MMLRRWAVGPLGRPWTFRFRSISLKVLVRLSSNCINNTRVGVKYIGTCTYLYLGTFFRVFACTLYLSLKNVHVLVPKYITKYLVLEDKYIASTSRFVPKKL